MTSVAQQRLVSYKRQLDRVKSRLQQYQINGGCPNTEQWKHSFADEEVIEPTRDATTAAQPERVTDTSNSLDSDYQLDASLLHEQSFFRKSDTLDLTNAAVVDEAPSIVDDTVDNDSFDEFDYVESIDEIVYPPQRSTDSCGSGHTPDLMSSSSVARVQQNEQKNSTRKVSLFEVHQRTRRNRFDEPGSMFYRKDPIWDSAGLSHDEIKRPYRKMTFSVRGDYPVRFAGKMARFVKLSARS